MKSPKRVVVSKCCEATIHYIPHSLSLVEQFFCSACNKVCQVKFIENKDEKIKN